MKAMDSSSLHIGAWRVDPALDQISKDGSTVKLERRAMQLLLCMAEHAGRVVSVEQLLDEVWAGVVVTPDSVYHAVAALRRTLGDDSHDPTYIANVPRRGYRLVAQVGPWVEAANVRLLNLLCSCTMGGEAPRALARRASSHYPLFSAHRDLFDITYLRTGPTFPLRTPPYRRVATIPVTLIPTLLDHRRRTAPLRPSAKRPRGEFFYFCSWWVEGISCQSPVQLRFGRL